MAEYKGLNIMFRGDTTSLSAALAKISRESKQAQGVLSGVNNAMKNAATNGKALNQTLAQMKVGELSNMANLAKERLSALTQAMPQLEAKLEKTSADLADARGKLDELAVSIGNGNQEIAALNSQFAQSQKAVALAREELGRYAEGTAEYEAAQSDLIDAQNASADIDAKRQKALKEASTEYGTMAGKVNSLSEKEERLSASIVSTDKNIKLAESNVRAYGAAAEYARLELDASNTRMGEFSKKAGEVGDALTGIGEKLTSVGDRMSIVSGIVAATFGKQIVGSTAEFGNTVQQIGGYLDLTGESLDRMSDLALQYGKDTKYSAQEAGEAIRELAKGGMEDAQIKAGALNSAMLLASAGNMDMASSAEVAVQAIKTFGVSAEDSASVADALAGAANRSVAEVSDLSQGFVQVGGAATNAGWDINEVSAAIALMADRGFTGAMAGTTLKTMLLRLANPTKAARTALNELGIEVRDSNGKMKDAVEVVGLFENALAGVSDEVRDKALGDIFGQRGYNGMVALLQEGTEGFKSYIQATKDSGYAAEMAKNQLGDLGWALELARGEAETAAVNFGNALAPKVIDVAKAVEGALSAFNNLSDGTQALVANLALMVVGTGPVLSVGGRLLKGLGGLTNVVSDGAKAISVYRTAMSVTKDTGYSLATAIAEVTVKEVDSVKRAQELAKATEGLQATFTKLASGAVIGAAILALSELIGLAVDLKGNFDLVSSATGGVSDAVAKASQQFDGYGNVMSTIAESHATMADTLKVAEEGLKSAADYAKDMGETLSNVGNDSGTLEVYAEKMKELSSESELTAYQQLELKNAVDQYNEVAGTSIQIMDETHGILNVLPDQIDKVTEAYKRQATTTALLELLNENIKAQQENQMKLEQTSRQMADAVNDVNGVFNLSIFRVAESEVAALKLINSYNGLKDSAKELADAQEWIEERLKSSSLSVDEYNDMLREMGISAKTASNANDDLGDSLTEMGDSAEEAANAVKRANDELYNATKRSLDREYSAQSRALTRAYNEYKRSLDNEKKELENYLNSRYKELETVLDKELEATKTANEKRLKEAKKANEQETKSFKAETEERLRVMEAEYDQRLKMLESQYDTSGIDQQIKALEDETKAEKAEAKKRAENEKKAELEKAVEQAKTRRKRADAEKALNEYMAELAQEAREAERSAQIEDLKEQKSILKDEYAQRKAELKDEYDQRVQLYKDSRAAELEAMEEANTAAYEMLKEQLDSQYSLQKEQNEIRLSDLKAQNQAEIDAMSERNEILLENQKEANQIQLENLKEAHEIQLEQLKNSLAEQLEAVKAGKSEEAKATDEANAQVLESNRRTTDEVIADLDRRIAESRTKLESAATVYREGSTHINKGFLDPFMDTRSKTNTIVSDIHNYALDKLKGLKTEMPDISKRSTDDFVKNVQNGKAPTGQAAQGLQDAIRQNTVNIPKQMQEVGAQGTQSMAAAIANGSGQVGQSAGMLANTAISALDSTSQWAQNSGWNFGINFANGMTNAQPYVANAAQSLANSAAAYLHHSTPDKGPMRDDDKWGGELVMNIVNGMRTMEPALASQASRIGGIISDSVRTQSRWSGNVAAPVGRTYESLRGGTSSPSVMVVMNGTVIREAADADRIGRSLADRIAARERRGL